MRCSLILAVAAAVSGFAPVAAADSVSVSGTITQSTADGIAC